MAVEIVRQNDLLPASKRRKEVFMSKKHLKTVRSAIKEPPLDKLWCNFLESIRGRQGTSIPPLPTDDSDTRDGVGAYYSVFKGCLHDILNSSFAYLVTDEPEFAELARERIRTVLSWHTWVHPAHYPKTIDLVSAEICRTLAVASQWLGGALPDDEREAVSSALFERVFEQYISGMLDETGWWSKDCVTNWCAVVNGGIGSALVHFLDENALLADILNEILKRFTIYLKGFEPDGGWMEGIMYWSYGITWYLYFADAVENATRGSINPARVAQMKKAGTFALHCYIPPDRMVNFCDSFSAVHLGLSIPLLKLAHEFSNPSLRWLASRTISLTNEVPSPYLFIWYSPGGEESPPEKVPTARVFRKIEWAILRSSWDDEAVVLATKAGYADQYEHTHLDAGTFILSAFGKPLITDLGRGRYSRDYFSSRRWSCIQANTAGHNTYIIDGRNQLPEKEHSGRITHLKRGKTFKYVRMDITDCYPSEIADSIIRHLILLEGAQCVILDEIDCPKDIDIEARFHYNGKGEIVSENEFVIHNEPARLQIKFASNTPVKIGEFRHEKLEDNVESQGVFDEKATRTYLSVSTVSPGETVCMLSLLNPFKTLSGCPVPELRAEIQPMKRQLSVLVVVDTFSRRLTWSKKAGKNVLDSVC